MYLIKYLLYFIRKFLGVFDETVPAKCFFFKLFYLYRRV